MKVTPTIASNGLRVYLPEIFRDKGWAEEWGEIQTRIDDTEGENITFDFTACRWADPLPLMSVLLEIMRAQHKGRKVSVRLPREDEGEPGGGDQIGIYQKSPNRLLLFLAHEGFFDAVDDLNKLNQNNKIGINYPEKPESMKWENYRLSSPELSYEDITAIPIRIIPPSNERNETKEQQVKEKVKELLNNDRFTARLNAHNVEKNKQESLRHKLHMALRETLENIFCHAYRDGAAFHVRFRNGKLSMVEDEKQKKYDDCINEEKEHCPGLRPDFLDDVSGCLEVFALDRGMGLAENLLTDIFDNGPQTPTVHRGLSLLHDLLKRGDDDVRIFNKGRWRRPAVVPVKESGYPTGHAIGADGRGTSVHPTQGFAWHLRLKWQTPLDALDSQKWEQLPKDKLLGELRKNEDSCEKIFKEFEENMAVWDQRFASSYKYNEKPGKWVLWLASPGLMRQDIIASLQGNEDDEGDVSSLAQKNACLIIADIPNHEATTYEAALSEDGGAGDWSEKFPKIILVTKSFHFHFVPQDGGTFRLPDQDGTLLDEKLSVAHALKWHDSKRIWERIGEPDRGLFLSKKVSWGSGENKRDIDGYLDFHRTTHDELCLNLYQNALARVVAVLAPAAERIASWGERLVEPVLQRFFAVHSFSNSSEKGRGLRLAAVLVKNILLSDIENNEDDLVYFFLHKSSSSRSGEYAALFHWLSPEIDSSEPVVYQQIGRTSAIAKHGEKGRCFEVPRFVQGTDIDEYTLEERRRLCIGERTPEETYADWQQSGNVICKAGHWTYQGHHDFLTLNIAEAVANSCLVKGELVCFLLREIFPFIGLEKSDLQEDWRHKFETESRPSKKPGILVYRSHPSTDAIIHKLYQDVLTEGGAERARKRTFPIQPVQAYWGQSTLLVPPMQRDKIKEELFKEKNGATAEQPCPVLLFDDVTITGRTLAHPRAMLRVLGATDITAMVIANRLRLPADSKNLPYNKDRHWLKYYWRFDVPYLGQGQNRCPLCHALSLFDVFSESLSSREAEATVKKWRQWWTAKMPLFNWSAGIRQEPITEKKRDFCYRDGKPIIEKGIVLNKSIGLTVFVTELHAMTGVDDFVLDKIKEQETPAVRIEIAASQILFFGDEFPIKIRLDLLEVLIVNLAAKVDELYASLAVLVAIHEIKSLDRHIVARKLLEILKKIAESSIQWNEALRIFCAFWVREKLITNRSEGSIQTFYRSALGLLNMDTWPLAEQLNSWFLELHSEAGNPHSRAIARTMAVLGEESELSDVDCNTIQRALSSMDHIQNIVEGLLETGFVRKDRTTDELLNRVLVPYHKAYGTAYNLLSQLTKTRALGDNKEVLGALRRYCDCIGTGAEEGVADCFFVCVRDMQDVCGSENKRGLFAKFLQKIIDRLKKSGKLKDKKNPVQEKSINFSNCYNGITDKKDRIWIAWHSGIERIVEDLIGNCRHAGEVINDPFGRKNRQAHMWIQVNYQDRYVDVRLVNTLKSTEGRKSVQIFNEMKKYRWSMLETVGGEISLMEDVKELFGLRIKIPYAGYLTAKIT